MKNEGEGEKEKPVNKFENDFFRLKKQNFIEKEIDNDSRNGRIMLRTTFTYFCSWQ